MHDSVVGFYQVLRIFVTALIYEIFKGYEQSILFLCMLLIYDVMLSFVC